MKIEPRDSLKHPISGGKKNAGTAPTAHFKTVLQKAVSGLPAVRQTGTVETIPPAVRFADFIPVADRKELIGRADQLINLLESYQSRLVNQGIPLTEAFASLKEVETQADKLAADMESLPEGDHFRDFLNRLVITVSVETIKFRRGDYL
jgi:hypothetical protein